MPELLGQETPRSSIRRSKGSSPVRPDSNLSASAMRRISSAARSPPGSGMGLIEPSRSKPRAPPASSSPPQVAPSVP